MQILVVDSPFKQFSFTEKTHKKEIELPILFSLEKVEEFNVLTYAQLQPCNVWSLF